MWRLISLIASVALSAAPQEFPKVTLQEKRLTSSQHEVKATFHLQSNELLIKDMIVISTDVPHTQLTWKSDHQTTSHYDPNYQRTLIGYEDDPTLDITINHDAQLQASHATLHIGFMTTAQNHAHHESFVLKELSDHSLEQQSAQPMVSSESNSSAVMTENDSLFTKIESKISSIFEKAKTSIKDWVTTTQSPIARLILVFLMGVLMSLTPCIYPMIPITVGILQTSASKSLLRNFLLALSYTIGQATTFAILGLLAATGSTQFGMLLGNPYFVIFLVSFLTYMALSMFGLYEIYIPNFLQSNNSSVQGGSFISAFIFGSISGSVASPCLSPGLLLLLSIVATLGNLPLGIAMLFCFGLGTAFPLLIIGTFSSSLSVLPKAGMWMVEIKKIFGFMLITMCFYYLNALLPWHIILALFAAFLMLLGVMMIITIQPWYGKLHKYYCYIIGCMLLIGSTFTAYQAVKAFLIQENGGFVWHTSYESAKEKALELKGLVLLDFGASWCTACKEIEHTILQNPQVTKALSHVVIAHIDCTNPAADSCAQIQKDYMIKGYPTLILVDPVTGSEIKRWGAEALTLGVAGFIHDITQCCH